MKKALAIFIIIVAVFGLVLGLQFSFGGFLDKLNTAPTLHTLSSTWGDMPVFPSQDTYDTILEAFQQFFDWFYAILNNIGKTVLYLGYDIFNLIVWILDFSSWGFA